MSVYVYVGSYTEPSAGSGEGISVYRFDPASGGLTLVQTVGDVANPSFLALGAGERCLYAVEELDEGCVSAFARDAETGRLTFLNRQASGGAAPCYVSLDGSGRYALVANYGDGTVAALPIAADGRLEPATGVVRHEGSSVDPERQAGPHAHMIAPTPDGRLLLVTDLGTDRILVYRLDDDTGRLLPNDRGPSSVEAAPGAGPRHFAFAPNGRRVYVINELASTLTAYDYDPRSGEMRARQPLSTLPDGFHGESTCAHVAVPPDGRFVYGSNRGHDSLAIFSVDPASGELTPVGHQPTGGKDPRNFAIDPTGYWLLAANQRSDTILTFRRDADAGTLAATELVTRTGSPVAIVFAGG